MSNKDKRIVIRFFSFVLAFALTFTTLSISAFATSEELLAEAEDRKNDTVESNETPDWPTGPLIGAKGAILYEANTGTILYAKNIHEQLFPASITKLMTCLVAVDNCDLNEKITVSSLAINSNDPNGSNMGLKSGEILTLEELLYGIMINSANEACNAIAEHIAGSHEAYVQMMNDKAKELGCLNTHFVTTNGLTDVNHYTSAYDMALIGSAFFSNEVLAHMSCLASYTIPENADHPEYSLRSHNQMVSGRTYSYDGLVGSKTGFTSDSRQTLVSCAERDGMKLVCVILREESPYQFEDTVALFDYGFSNFKKVNVMNYETKYSLSHSGFFDIGNDIFHNSKSSITFEKNPYIIMPVKADFSQIKSQVVYGDNPKAASFAHIEYDFNGTYLGSMDAYFTTPELPETSISESEDAPQIVMLNIRKPLIGLFVSAGLIILYLVFNSVLRYYHFEIKRASDIKKRHGANAPKRHRTHRVHRSSMARPQKKDTSPFSKRSKHPFGSQKSTFKRNPSVPHSKMGGKVNFKDLDV